MKATVAERAPASDSVREYDVIIIGAGAAGLHAIYRLRGQGLNVICLEAGDGVGGTWYWNRYPGARVDIESVEYSYTFSEELQQEWEWPERYSAQPELMRYFNHVADRFDLRRSIEFNSRVATAHFNENEDRWDIETTDGRRFSARYVVMATGFLSAPNQPNFPGQDSFKGKTYHTAYWPAEGVDFSGQRVGIIGTGSSAVQAIPIIAQQAKHLTVFQRTPNFSVPLRNGPLSKEFEAKVKGNYAEWRRMEREDSFTGMIWINERPEGMVTKLTTETTPEEREAMYEDRWQNGGICFYNIYPDTFSDPIANEYLADFMRNKIREKVKDPEVAELLCPKDYPVLTKRLCADTNYYETYNRDNVTLVDIRGKDVTLNEQGVAVDGEGYELDAVIFATGFDALTGALTRIDLRGIGGRALKDHWADGARTAYGLMVAGFPNLFLINGPGSPTPLFQPVLLGEEQGNWFGDWISYMAENGYTRIDAAPETEDQWVQRCTDVINATLFPKARSWYMGANIPGKPSMGLVDFGGIWNYRKYCTDLLPNGFPGFTLSGGAQQGGQAEMHVGAATAA